MNVIILLLLYQYSSATDCGPQPPVPTLGSCPPEYTLLGDGTLSCNTSDGTWVGSICQPNSCEKYSDYFLTIRGYLISGYNLLSFPGSDVRECINSCIAQGQECVSAEIEYGPRCFNNYESFITLPSAYNPLDISIYFHRLCSGVNENECLHSPCKNGGTCTDTNTGFQCTCTEGYYGDTCEMDVCKPVPADIFFLLDSSASQTNETFGKQLEFVMKFVDEVEIGEDAFKISVITFSFRANVEFSLDVHSSREEVNSALKLVQLKPGSTNTAAALQEVVNVKGPLYRQNGQQAKKIVVVITDGLSTYRQKTLDAADDLHNHVDKIITIGVGPDVSQEELLGIASPPDEFSHTNAFSVNHSDSLNTILRQLVFYTCRKCYQSSKSDVVFLVDSSVSVNIDQFGIFKDAMVHIVSFSNVGIENNDTVFSAFTFTDNVREQFDFKTHTNSSQDTIKTDIAKIRYDGGYIETYDIKSDLSKALSFAQEYVFVSVNGARDGARKFLILFINGNDITFDKDVLERARSQLHDMKVSVVVFAEGDTPDLDLLKSIPSDPYFLFVHTSDSNLQTLDTLSSEFTYNVCDLD